MMTREGVRMMVRGRVTMDTVPALFEQGSQHLNSEDLLVDWAQVETVDSAAVSMLLAWERAAQRRLRSLQVVNLPENLLSLARLYGVEDLLPKQAI